MRIFPDIPAFHKYIQNEKNFPGTAVAIGKFDGVHRGHQKLLDTIIRLKKERGYKTAVFTFDRSIASFFTGKEQKVLTTNHEKRETLADLEIDYLIEFPVNEVTAGMEPEIFIRDVLVKGLSAKAVAAGPDCSFGKGGRGDLALLKQMEREIKDGAGQVLSYEMIEVDKVRYHDEIISSTLVRDRISNGDMEMVHTLLGRPYSLEGKVSHGRKLGSSVLEMPTVNIVPEHDKLLPPYGVYFSNVVIGTQVFHSITNIGQKPTIKDDDAVNAETFLYDFDEDLYGEELRVELLHWHREERKFPDLEHLKKQMHHDMMAGRDFFIRKEREGGAAAPRVR